MFSKLLETFYLLTCSGINDKRKGCLYTLLSISSFLFWDLYQKEIMGLTIVEVKVEPYSTIWFFSASGFRLSGYKLFDVSCDALNITSEDLYYQQSDKGWSFDDYIRNKVGWRNQARWNLRHSLKHSADDGR